MKIIYTIMAGFLVPVMVTPCFSQSPEQLLQQKARSQQMPALPQNASVNWYENAVKNIEKREYEIKSLKAASAYGAFNRKQELGFMFRPDGYEVKRFDIDKNFATGWQVDFKLKGIGRNGHVSFSTNNHQRIENKDLLRYRYRGFNVEYVNNEAGMRQDFIVTQKPSGKGSLRVDIDIESSLEARVDNGARLILHTAGKPNDVQLMYDGLKAWDANHKLLPAAMEYADGSLAIVVNDKNAVYPITIDPLNHAPDWTDSGNGLVFPLLNDLSAHLLYGFTVSGAGDVNNDNIDDIIVGAPAYVDIVSISGGTFNAASVGAAFIYYGSASGPSTDPAEALQPTAFAGALFGFSVSKAGDINGDGFDDVVIGAPGDHVDLSVTFSTVSATVGKVYIYYGNTFDGNLTTEPVVSLSVNLNQADFGVPTLAAIPANPLYGFSVSNAGDVNNDGFADIVVGSPAYLSLIPLSLGGRVDVYMGSGAGLNTTPHKITGGLVGGLLGYSVSNAGKVNNDVYDDIIAGAPASLGLVAVGAAYVFHGSATGITATTVAGANTTLQQPGLLSQTLFGFSVSNAGDVNGDGRADVIVGEPLSLEQTLSLQLVAIGKAHIFYGSNTGIVTTGETELTSPRRPNLLGLLQGNLLYGFSVSTAGDVNCDGLSDVIIGEPGGTAISLGTGVLGLVSANAVSGKAYVYYGRTNKPINSPSFQVQDTGALSVANLLGASVSDAGDVNGNGAADILIGAPNGTLSFASSLTGIVGSALGFITQNSVGSAYSYFGCLTNIDLDFDNDGIPDAVDLDDDNDGVPDLSEYPGVTLTDDPAGDADGDGIPNYRDTDFTGCVGLNGAGICTTFDKDGDGVPNSFDLDSDNDGIPDVVESGGVDANGDGILDNFTDTDDDGLAQVIDLSNTGAAGSGTGLGAPDFDGDGIPNSLDIDSDGDGIIDLREAGLPDANNDGRVDGFADADGDGFTDVLDPKSGHSGAADPAGPGTPVALTPTDTTNDGRFDGAPATLNADADLRFNFLDIDSDNDGITDNVEIQTTTGYVLPAAGDTDNDGLANIYDSQGGTFTAGGIVPVNTDGADQPDYLDTDADNDLLPDLVEGHDFNNNGQPDDVVALTGTDTDNDGLDNRFDLAAGPVVTTSGIGTPVTPGSNGPLQSTYGGERDWRNALVVLPLDLTSFSAKQNGAVNLLEWTSENEDNVSHFEVQRSGDGRSFTGLGDIAATGTLTGPAHYSFVDQQPLSDKNYYRLKMVDIDGRFSYSNVLLLSASSNARGINIYPNPARDQFQLVWQQMPPDTYRVDMINTGGQVIKTFSVKVNSNNQVLLINRDNLWKPGVYLLRIIRVKDKSVVTKSVIMQ